MKFNYVAFRNYGPFERARIEFSGRLIGILGLNGTGKSTVVETLYSALSGKFRKYPDLVDYVRDLPGGLKPTSGWFEVGATIGGADIVVRRTIAVSPERRGGGFKGTQKAKLQVKAPGAAEPEVVEGVRNVDARLSELLGEDVQVIGDYAFVQQDSIGAIVAADTSTRTKMLHRLFGLEHYEKVWSTLGDEFNAIPNLQSTDDVDAIRVEQHRLEAELERLQNDKLALEQALDALGATQAQADIDAWESLQSLRDSVTKVEEARQQKALQLTRATAALDTAQVEAQRLSSEQLKLESSAAAARVFLAEAESSLYTLRRLEELRGNAAVTVNQMKALAAPTYPTTTWTPEDDTALLELQTRLHVSVRFVNEHAKFIVGGNVSAKCPTCGQSISDLAGELARHQSAVSELTPQATQLGVKKASCTQALQKYATADAAYKATLASLQSAGKALLDQIAELSTKAPKDPSIFDQAACDAQRAVIRAYDQCCGAVSSARRAVAAAETSVKTAQRELDEAEAAGNTLHGQLQALGPAIARLNPDHISGCRHTVMLASAKKVELVQTQERERGVKVSIQATELRLQQAEALMEQIKKFKLARQTLSDARELFHRDNLPRKLANRFVHAIDTQLSKFLDLMQSAFTAHLLQTPDGYDFRCVFSDTSERSASNLSGGEKVRFSVAFLLAVYAVRSAGLGVLSLDEPTAQLDDEQVERLVTVLDRIREYAASADMQIFMITHSKQLDSVFDHVVRLPLGVSDEVEE